MDAVRPLLLLLCACALPPEPPKPLGTVTMAEALAGHYAAPQPPVDGKLAPRAAVLAASAVSTYALRYPPTLCDAQNDQMLPFLSCRGVGPTVGSPWVLDAWTRVARDTGPQVGDTAPAWLVVGWDEYTPGDYTSWGMPGCWLLVEPKLVVYLPVGIDDGLVSRSASSPGRMELRWTPPGTAAGNVLWFQLLVAAPTANPFGLVGGPALRVTVGG